jgi:hypothetical protein
VLATFATPVLWPAERANRRSGRARRTQARLGSTSSERLKLPRDVGITPGADTIADRERHRGLHPVPDDMLLAPGTDDLERGHASMWVGVQPSFRHRIRFLSHRCSPSPIKLCHHFLYSSAGFVSLADTLMTFGSCSRF